MAKARKAVKRRKAKRKSAAKTKPRKVSARKAKARKSKPRKAVKQRRPRRPRKQKGVVDRITEGVEAIQESFEESAKMQERAGTRWGTGEG